MMRPGTISSSSPSLSCGRRPTSSIPTCSKDAERARPIRSSTRPSTSIATRASPGSGAKLGASALRASGIDGIPATAVAAGAAAGGRWSRRFPAIATQPRSHAALRLTAVVISTSIARFFRVGGLQIIMELRAPGQRAAPAGVGPGSTERQRRTARWSARHPPAPAAPRTFAGVWMNSPMAADHLDRAPLKSAPMPSRKQGESR